MGPFLIPGAAKIVHAAACFAVMTVLARKAGQAVDPLFLVWVRGAGGFALLLPLMLRRRVPILGRHRLHLSVRAAAGCISVCFVFLAAKWIPTPEATSLFKTSALFTPFLAAWLLKEHLHWAVVRLTLLGFAGVLLVVQPCFQVLNRGVAYALAAGIVQAFVYTTLRSLSSREQPLTVVGYFLAGSALFTTPFVSWPNALSADLLLCLVGIVGSGLLGQIFLTNGYADAPAARVTPYLYAEVLFTMLISWAWLGELPNLAAALGMAIICAAGIALARLGLKGVPTPETELIPEAIDTGEAAAK